LDGLLDDAEWSKAGIIPDLEQAEPHPGELTPFRTQVLVLVDSEALYLGFNCIDPEPRKISIHTLQRDASLDADDYVVVTLDSFVDHRTGYFFRMNSAGAREDGLIFGPTSQSSDWDGLWEGAARRTSTGWTAEIVIPARTLHFDPKLSGWGFNVERFVSRHRMTLRWSGISLNANVFDMRRAGRLEGLGQLQQGWGLSVIPYGLGRYRHDRSDRSEVVTGDMGADVAYNVTPNLTGVLTINTDFAETEVDTRQINLTRFPLFFPEKRAFFLEGSSEFDFGAGLEEDFIPFFSRRIGLFAEQEVPILSGFKLIGKQGRTGIGFVDAQTGESGGAKATNLLATRLTYDLDQHTRVGGILTNGDPAGINGNRVYGLDAVWETSSLWGDQNLILGGWGVRSDGDVTRTRRNGWGLMLEYPNDLWDVFGIAKELGDDLNPALGFLPRPGARFYDLGGAFQPRPRVRPFTWIRQFFFELNGRRVDDLDGMPESWEIFAAPFNIVTQSGEHLETNWSPRYERLLAPFEVSSGVNIPVGEYHFTRYRVEAQSSPHRNWRIGSTVWFGEFYDGHLTQAEGFLNYTTPSGHLHFELSSENDTGRLPEGDFVERLHQLKVQYSFTPDLWISAYTQYDSESNNVGTNARLQWTVKPGDDLFLVWNRSWERSAEEDQLADFSPDRDEIILKLRLTFRR